MTTANQQARKMFFDDVTNTYTRIQTRCKQILEERSQEPGVETLQLQAAGEDITVNIPTPEDKQAYEVFCALPEKMQNALKDGTLDTINKALETFSFEDAETIIKVCSQYGFLDVGEQVIDETGQQQQQQQQ